MTKSKNKLQIIGNVIFFVVAIFIIFLAISNFLEKKNGKALSIFGYSTYYVLTGSMEPTMPPGSLLITKHEPAGSYKVGDVITFKTGNSVTSHRIVAIEENGKAYQTKGDANLVSDPVYRPASSVVGKVVFHVPYVGSVLKFIKEHLIFIIGLVILFYLVESGIYKLLSKGEKKSQ